jgi:hypothetical protein
MAANADTTLRNAWLTALADAAGPNPKIRLRTGTKPANAGAARTGTILATILVADGFDTPVDGAMGLVTPGPSAEADDTGDIGHWELVTNDGATVILQANVGEILSFNTNTIDDVGQVVAIATFDLTAPNP